MSAGYFRGKVDMLAVGFIDILLAFPSLVLALTFTAYLGQSLFNVTLALGILSIPAAARVARANTLAWANRDFVLAARTIGASDWRILTREILPNLLPPMFAFWLVAISVIIVAEGALSCARSTASRSRSRCERSVEEPGAAFVGAQCPGELLDSARAVACSRWRIVRPAMIFQDPMTSLNPVMTIGRQIAKVLVRTAACRRAARARVRGAARARSRIPDPRARSSTRTRCRAACASA
jgi:ABC-type dipeptide/oligopeptide/nickel transport system ATPase component